VPLIGLDQHGASAGRAGGDRGGTRAGKRVDDDPARRAAVADQQIE
jgi:hypothetical protein